MILETRHSIPEILSRQPLFRVLGGMELVALSQATLEYRVRHGEMLFQKGEAARGMHLVVAGQVKLFLPADNGSDKVVLMAGPGDSFGDESAFLDKPYPVAAEACKESIVLLLDKAALIAAVEANAALARAIMARLCTRFCDLVENMETCVQRSSDQRVVHYLTQLAPAQADAFEVRLDTNKQTIASQLNLAPETFSRVLGRLAKAGFIRVHGRTITVMQANALRGYAAG
jgi:CRP-like cAMP-binding protein